LGNKKKGDLEKIYTPPDLTLKMLAHLKKFYDGEITQFLEPASGNGAIIDVLKKEYPTVPVLAFDIKNEANRNDIIEMNFLKPTLKYDLSYKKGRVTIMNPPFSKAIIFIKRCLEVSDFVISITGINSFINLDYNLIDAKKIDIYKKYTFLDGKNYGICIISMKKEQ